jgi:hypothetical protein
VSGEGTKPADAYLLRRVPSGLRSAVYCTAIARGGPAHWQFLWEHYKNEATNMSERNSALKALGCSEDTDILKL